MESKKKSTAAAPLCCLLLLIMLTLQPSAEAATETSGPRGPRKGLVCSKPSTSYGGGRCFPKACTAACKTEGFTEAACGDVCLCYKPC